MLLSLSRFFTSLSIFCVTIVLTSTFFPFIGGKYYFFRTCIELALICLILWWAFQAEAGELEKRLKKIFQRPLVKAVSLFVLMFILATIFAQNPHGAFWSNYERAEGGFQMIHYWIFFMLLVILFEKEEDWRMLFKVSLASGALLILYGIAAANLYDGFVGPYRDGAGKPYYDHLWGQLFSDIRFQGSLGNPAYVAPYLLFSIFYAAFLWLGRFALKDKVRNALYVFSTLFFFTFFILSQTRGAFIGLVVGGFVALLYLTWVLPKARVWITGIILAILFLGGTLYSFREYAEIQKIPGARLVNFGVNADSLQTRFWTWGSAWEGFKEHPLLGWGPENFSSVFDKHFNINHFVPNKNAETWFDRAHSVVFDYLATTGILGLLSYVGMFAVFLLQLFSLGWFSHRNHEEKDIASKEQRIAHKFKHMQPFLNALLLGVVIAYLVQGLALFDVLPIYINVFFVLAFASFWFTHREHPTSHNNSHGQ